MCKGNGSFQEFSLGIVNSVIISPEIVYIIIRKTPRTPEHILTLPSIIMGPFGHNLDTKTSNKKPESEAPDWVLLNWLLSLALKRNKNKSDKKKNSIG